MKGRGLAVALIVVLGGSVAGCANFRRLDADVEAYANSVAFKVRVAAPNWSGAPLLVVLMTPGKQPGMPPTVEWIRTLAEPGTLQVRLVPGQYIVGAYEDLSGDTKLQIGQEPVAVYQDMAPFPVGKPNGVEEIELTLSHDVPKALLALKEAGEMPDASRLRVNEGAVASLDDPRFEPEHAHVGVWQPLRFVEEYGAGVFMLQEYDPNRIPVLFVHGMGGHPREFKDILKALDEKRFQPWVAFYPSGFRLGQLAQALEAILYGMKARHRFEKMYLVAHSMGGLVSRKVLSLHAARETPPFIRRFITLSSPLGGMASADKGVERAPSVVPSWRDLGPSSDYVHDLYDDPLPEGLRYTLLFGYGDSSWHEASDGVVPVSSQLRKEAQLEADAESGYETTHVGILRDEDAIRAVMRALTDGEPEPPAPPPNPVAAADVSPEGA